MIDEGYIKFQSHWEKTGPLPLAGLEELIRWRRPLHDAGLIGHYDEPGVGYGNLSTRATDEGLFLISGTQTGHITSIGPTHFALVTDYDIERNTICCRGPVEASSESMTHAAAYDASPLVRCVLHAHSPVLWDRRRELGLPETDPAVPSGTPGMALEVGRLYRETVLPERGILAMGGHEDGIMVLGQSPEEAGGILLRWLSRAYAVSCSETDRGLCRP